MGQMDHATGVYLTDADLREIAEERAEAERSRLHNILQPVLDAIRAIPKDDFSPEMARQIVATLTVKVETTLWSDDRTAKQALGCLYDADGRFEQCEREQA